MPPDGSATTVGQLLEQACASLRSAEVDAPRLTAETLLASAFERDRTWIFAHPETIAGDDRRDAFAVYLERRLAGEPTHYILGAREFFGLEIECGPGALTPRPETEHLVETALATAPPFGRIADVGCGPGTIALPLVGALSDAQIIGVDISAAALEYAQRNAARHQLRLELIETDLLACFGDGALDLVLSNPPYIAEDDRAALPPELGYEPEIALFGGPDGLDVYRRLAPQAFRALRPGGKLIVELGDGLDEPVSVILSRAGFRIRKVVSDLQEIPRVLVAGKPG